MHYQSIEDEIDSKEGLTLKRLQVGSCLYGIAFGERAGQKVLAIESTSPQQDDAWPALTSMRAIVISLAPVSA
jgi:hypothetical protein